MAHIPAPITAGVTNRRLVVVVAVLLMVAFFGG